MTEEQILKAEGEELSRLLGEVLQPKNSHVWQPTDNPHVKWCSKCGFYENEDLTVSPCEIPDPIPLNDANIAMKWRDRAVEKVGKVNFHIACKEVKDSIRESLGWEQRLYGTDEWFAFYGQPKHYLKAAALCEIRSKI